MPTLDQQSKERVKALVYGPQAQEKFWSKPREEQIGILKSTAPSAFGNLSPHDYGVFLDGAQKGLGGVKPGAATPAAPAPAGDPKPAAVQPESHWYNPATWGGGDKPPASGQAPPVPPAADTPVPTSVSGDRPSQWQGPPTSAANPPQPMFTNPNTPKPKGMVTPGNIDLRTLPVVDVGGGKWGTVRSSSFGFNGKEVLLPTIVNGKPVSDKEAQDEYRKTGRHLGVFDTPANADPYAQQLHSDWEAGKINGVQMPKQQSGAAPTPPSADGFFMQALKGYAAADVGITKGFYGTVLTPGTWPERIGKAFGGGPRPVGPPTTQQEPAFRAAAQPQVSVGEDVRQIPRNMERQIGGGIERFVVKPGQQFIDYSKTPAGREAIGGTTLAAVNRAGDIGYETMSDPKAGLALATLAVLPELGAVGVTAATIGAYGMTGAQIKQGVDSLVAAANNPTPETVGTAITDTAMVYPILKEVKSLIPGKGGVLDWAWGRLRNKTGPAAEKLKTALTEAAAKAGSGSGPAPRPGPEVPPTTRVEGTKPLFPRKPAATAAPPVAAGPVTDPPPPPAPHPVAEPEPAPQPTAAAPEPAAPPVTEVPKTEPPVAAEPTPAPVAAAPEKPAARWVVEPNADKPGEHVVRNTATGETLPYKTKASASSQARRLNDREIGEKETTATTPDSGATTPTTPAEPVHAPTRATIGKIVEGMKTPEGEMRGDRGNPYESVAITNDAGKSVTIDLADVSPEALDRAARELGESTGALKYTWHTEAGPVPGRNSKAVESPRKSNGVVEKPGTTNDERTAAILESAESQGTAKSTRTLGEGAHLPGTVFEFMGESARTPGKYVLMPKGGGTPVTVSLADITEMFGAPIEEPSASQGPPPRTGPRALAGERKPGSETTPGERRASEAPPPRTGPKSLGRTTTEKTTATGLEQTPFEPARTSTGKVKIGADIKSLAEDLGSSLYKGNDIQVVTKELTQNALDAIRSTPGGRVHIDLNRWGGRTITITDNGKGMSRRDLETVFTDLGASGKRDDPTASGGFGLAKAAPLMMSQQITVETVNAKGGKKFQSTMTTNKDELLGQGADIHTIEVPATTPTGTKIVATMRNDDYSAWNDAQRFATNTLRSRKLPGKLDITIDGESIEKILSRDEYTTKRLKLGERGETKHAGNLKVPGADVEIHTSKGKKGLEHDLGSVPVEVNNNGIFQFEHSIWLGGGASVEGVPAVISIDVKANVPEGHTDYPFTANRESLRGGQIDAELGRWVKENIIEPSQKKAADFIAKKYDSLPHVGQDFKVAVFDSGARLTENEMASLERNPDFVNLSEDIAQVIDDSVADLMSREQKGSLENIGKGIERAGIVFSDDVHGVYIPHPKTGKSTVFINPFTWEENSTPRQAATLTWHTIRHEILHDTVKGHSQAFTSSLVRLDEQLAEQFDSAIKRLHYAYEDPATPGRFRRGITDARAIYKESRARPEQERDPFKAEESRRGK